MTTGTVQGTASTSVRERTLAVLDDMLRLGHEYDLPDAPDTLPTARDRLAVNRFNVLVTGEVKRGKSTFVNSLIGRNLLPTGVEVVTNQAFRVTRAAEEAYRVRFADGSARDITADELATYGSQVEVKKRRRKPDQEIRWIEIDAPVQFLPEGLSIIDTPGMGSLYKSHAEVTYRLVPYADAVIFCLSSDRPIDQDELDFVENLAGVTRNIFFLQTMIDRYQEQDGAHWKEVQARNEQILAERFGDRVADTHVWPLSATWLLMAAGRTDPNDPLLRVHKDLIARMRQFLFYVAGWYPTAQAVIAARQYLEVGRATLRERLVGEAKEAQERQAELKRRKQDFELNWGARGRKRDEMLATVNRRLMQGKNTFSTALTPQGAIFAPIIDKINHIETIEEANTLGEAMVDAVAAATLQGWQRLNDGIWHDIDGLLAPLAADAASVALAPSMAGPQLEAQFEPIKTSFLATLTYARSQFFGGYIMGSMGVTALTIVGIVPVGAAAIATSLVGFGAIALGWNPAKGLQLKAARQELLSHLEKLRQQVYHHFFAADLDTGKLWIDEYFEDVQRTLAERITQLVERAGRDVQREIDQMAEVERLSDQERRERAERLQSESKAWDALLPPLQQIQTALERFAPLSGTPAGAARTTSSSKAP